jgi:type II secretion system protein N
MATRYLGYVGFFLLSFVMGLYLTFPWNVAKDRLIALAEARTGMGFKARSLEPSWVTGVIVEDLEITPQGKTTAIHLDRVKARVSLLRLIAGKLGISFALPLGKGAVEGDLMIDDEVVDIEAKVAAVQLDQVAFLLEMTGLPLVGTIDLDADLVLGKKDPKKTEGKLLLKTAGLKIEKGGKIGMFPVPVDLDLGTLTLDVPIKEGRAELKGTRLPGTDLEILLDGDVSPQLPFSKSNVNLMVGLKPSEKIFTAEPLFRALLKNFESAKDPEGFYGISLTGSLQHPRVQMRRR